MPIKLSFQAIHLIHSFHDFVDCCSMVGNYFKITNKEQCDQHDPNSNDGHDSLIHPSTICRATKRTYFK